MASFHSSDVRQLLHNKFVVVLGDSIQRSVYKDLVKLLRVDEFLSERQLKDKGERVFENDTLVEGGILNGLHNETTFREVRQFKTGHHLVRFYFLTRVYSFYLESILSDFQSGPQPDVVMVNSCVWDLGRYNDITMEAYKANLNRLFQRLNKVLSPECLIIWTTAMPVGHKDNEMPETPIRHNLRWDIVEGNVLSTNLANFHKLDVLDMHYHFRCDLRLRCHDAVHWNKVAHRKYTQILLAHIAGAWGVEPPKKKMVEGVRCPGDYTDERPINPDGAAFIPGYTSFDGSSIDATPGVRCPGDYTDERPINPDASSAFVTDSTLLTPNITCGYYNPPPGPAFPRYPVLLPGPAFPRYPVLLPGPAFPRYPVARNFHPLNMPPPMYFPPFPHHFPYPQNAWNIKRKLKKTFKSKGVWSHPYR